MAFWSKLGKLAAIGAAPFTGGASLAAVPMIDAIGSTLSSAAKGSADQRVGENSQAATAAQIAGTQANQQFQNQLASSNYSNQSADRATKRAILMALMGGAQDASIDLPSRIPKVTINGGMRPSSLLGGDNRQLLMSLMGSQMDAPTPTYQAPAAYQPAQAGKVEKGLGAAGLGLSLYGQIGRAMGSRRPDLYGVDNPE